MIRCVLEYGILSFFFFFFFFFLNKKIIIISNTSIGSIELCQKSNDGVASGVSKSSHSGLNSAPEALQ